MSLKPLFLFACTLCALPLMAQKNYTLTSPDGTLQATVATGSDLRISLSADGETLLAPSPVSMTLGGGEVLGSNPKVTRARKNTADARIASPFYKKGSVRDHYNELELTMRGDYGLVVRLYDDGLAYRFTTRKRTASWSRTSRSPIPSRAIIRRTPPMSGTSGCSISKGSSAIRSRTPTPVSR